MQTHAHLFNYLTIDMNTLRGLRYVGGGEIGNGMVHMTSKNCCCHSCDEVGVLKRIMSEMRLERGLLTSHRLLQQPTKANPVYTPIPE